MTIMAISFHLRRAELQPRGTLALLLLVLLCHLTMISSTLAISSPAHEAVASSAVVDLQHTDQCALTSALPTATAIRPIGSPPLLLWDPLASARTLACPLRWLIPLPPPDLQALLQVFRT